MVATYRHRGLRPADVVLASYPKSGSTWLRFALASALSSQEMDFDLVRDVSPPVGDHRDGPLVVPGGGRLIKSHEGPRFVGPRTHRPRVLFLVRDPRDVAVSYFHHLRRIGLAGDDFDVYFDDFVRGRLSSLGSWQAHTRSWLHYAAAADNVMTLRYEDLLADPVGTLIAVDDNYRLGLDEATIRTAIERSTPVGMRAKEASSRWLRAKSVNSEINFVREAKAGGWRDTLAPELSAQLETAARRELLQLGYTLRNAHLP